MLPLTGGLLLLALLQRLHSTGILRSALIGRYGVAPYRVGGATLAIGALALIVAGKSDAAYHYVWLPPVWLHLFMLPLMFVAFVFVAASLVPSNLRRLSRRPVLWGIAVGATAHLLVTGDLAAMILFGGLALLALLEIGSPKQRTLDHGVDRIPWARESLTVAIGGMLLIGFFYLHAELFGVSASMMDRHFM